jgi:hypothetical protein
MKIDSALGTVLLMLWVTRWLIRMDLALYIQYVLPYKLNAKTFTGGSIT